MNHVLGPEAMPSPALRSPPGSGSAPCTRTDPTSQVDANIPPASMCVWSNVASLRPQLLRRAEPGAADGPPFSGQVDKCETIILIQNIYIENSILRALWSRRRNPEASAPPGSWLRNRSARPSSCVHSRLRTILRSRAAGGDRSAKRRVRAHTSEWGRGDAATGRRCGNRRTPPSCCIADDKGTHAASPVRGKVEQTQIQTHTQTQNAFRRHPLKTKDHHVKSSKLLTPQYKHLRACL